ncbi:hypothetical protein MOMA_09266 [Moraxella macacae 0408225]|uniref:Phage protein, HK97 gp10 family n=1 Tax=Moraxella macacae 0408225 TaxID=1230338 RepID=L2F6R9_9GAMM|nr:HK97-gp10 family putative phage morphogenesis protein [Moraxella macacae]ELA08737.1 hypothetical protein MOMA_09266 [Moraxella macacae 0408225]
MIGSIDVAGLDIFNQAIAELDNKLKDKILSKALNQALNPIRKDAKFYATVAQEPHIMITKSGRRVIVQRGLLRSAIRKRKVPKHEMGELGGQGVAMGIYVGKGTKQKEYPNYWHFVEYGTIHTPAMPFLRPAFDKNVQIAVNAFAKTLKDEIDKIIK